MKNKESILKKEIDIANLSVSIIPTIAFIIVFALAFSVSVLGEYCVNNGFDLVHDVKSLSRDYLILSYLDFDVLVTLIGGALIALWNFSFLLNKNHARAVLLQPKKRDAIFNNKVTIPLIALVLIVIVIKIIALLVNIKYNNNLADGYIAPFIANILVSLTTLFWGYMCGVAGTILPGRKIEAILGGVSIALLPNAIINIFNFSATAFLRGYTFENYVDMFALTILDPLREFFSYSSYKTQGNIFIHSAIWIVVSVIGLILIKKYFEKNYKFENCGMVNKNKFITFVSGFSLPIVLSGYLTDELFYNLNPNANVINISTEYRENWYYERLTPEEPFILLAVFVGLAIMLSLVFNIITTVKISNLKEKAKPMIVILGSTVIISLVCLTGGLGYENRLPDVENIETVEVQAPYDLVENNAELIGMADYYDVNTAVLREGIKFDNAEDIEKVLAIHSLVMEDKNKETTEGIKLTYKLKNGSVIERSYRYISKDCAEEILKLWNTNKVKELYKMLLSTEERKEDNELMGISLFEKSYFSMQDVVYIQSKDAVLTSITDLLTEDEIKDLKEVIYKDISSLAYFEWFKPTESYGLLQFSSKELTKEPLSFVVSSQSSVSFQVTKEMTNTVEFLKAHDLMKFFDIKREPVAMYLVDANELGGYYKDFLQEVDRLVYCDSYPMQHRMMFVSETSVSKHLYVKDAEPMLNINEPWCKKLTTEEYRDYIEKSHIKYFSGEGGKLLVVAYPESNCAYSLVLP